MASRLIFLVLLFAFLLSCKTTSTRATGKLSARNLVDSVFVLHCIEQFDTAGLPRYKVLINFHYIETGSGTFYCGSKDDWNHSNGITYAQRILNHVNSDMRQVKANPAFQKNFIGDARYRFELYSDSTRADDLHGGIWFWKNGLPLKLPYGDSVLHVLFYELGEIGDRQLTGYACGLNQCNRIVLYDAYDCSRKENYFGWWSYAGLMNHEFCHIMGLCHSFYCDNPCDDLPQEAECFSNPCFDDCGGPNNKHCNAWDTGSNNVMGYHKEQSTFSPCQWQQLFGALYKSHALFVVVDLQNDKGHTRH